ncbi:hypothetical protein TURU_113781 [Turdus rufiventris]|nr:hypothetical protein TURU_113781 [Turdus rufiventris]
MPRRRVWSEAEVSTLLSLVLGSGEAALLMASTSPPNEALWREISQGLAEAGYKRSVIQCRCKWKELKQAFYSEREMRRGAEYQLARLPPYYRAMKSIWEAAGRPVLDERRMPEHDIGGNTPSTLLSPVMQCAKEPKSFFVTGFPGETSLGMARGNQMLPLAAAATGSHGTAAMSEQPAASKDASDTSLHGSDVTGLLQNIQQVLVQILQMSQQQQALLESLASDIVSHLHLFSRSLMQVAPKCPAPLVHPNPSPDLKEEPQLTHDARCIPAMSATVTGHRSNDIATEPWHKSLYQRFHIF